MPFDSPESIADQAQPACQKLPGDRAARHGQARQEPGNLLLAELRHTFRSFRHRNFRLYFVGQLVSLSGTWMQSLAVNWLVYRLTKSAFMLGVVNMAGLVPVLVLGLAGGWVADRADRRQTLLAVQALAMLQAIALAVLTFSGHLQVWHVIVLAAFLGAVNAFEMPARQALVVNMVHQEDVVNAISLNASLFHAARTVGPAAAGILVATAGEGTCFALNAVSFLAALVAIWLIRVPRARAVHPADRQPLHVAEAFRFAFSTPHVLDVLALAAAASLFGMPYLVLMPVVASEVLHREVGALGALMAGASVGSCASALILANRATGELLRPGVGYACLGFSAALFAFAVSANFYLSLALTVPLGFCITSQLSGSHSLLQLAVSDELRGRVSSIWMMTMLGLLPLGSLAVGWFASLYGASTALVGCAGLCAISAVFYLKRFKP